MLLTEACEIFEKLYLGVTNLFVEFRFVLGGDFQQILPVIPHGGRQDIVASLERLSLTQNMYLDVDATPEVAG